MTSAVMSRTMPHLMAEKSPMIAETLVGVLARRPFTVPDTEAGMPSRLPTLRDSGTSGYKRCPVAGTRSLRSSEANWRLMAMPLMP